MTTETQELKACWCCNAPALLERDGDHHGEWFNLGCSRHWEAVPDRAEACPAGRIWYTADPDELEAAITAWNTRPREAELEAEVGRLRAWLSALEPHLDAVICYASDMDEHPPNRVVAEVRAYISHPKGADDGC